MYKKDQCLKVIAAAKEKLAVLNVEEKAKFCGFRKSDMEPSAPHLHTSALPHLLFEIPFFTEKLTLSLPELELARPNGRPASRILQAVVLHHLIAAEGTPLGGKFIPFREMPGLAPYQHTIKWRIFDFLTRAFGSEPARLRSALPGLGGTALKFGDASALFWPLPQIPIQVVIWGADEIEPAAANMLFDESVTKLLPLEDIVVLGEIAAHRLKAEAAAITRGGILK